MKYVLSADGGPMALKLDRDRNGNRILRVRFPNRSTGFSIQTNGNLPCTHRMAAEAFDYQIASDEVKGYISRYGTLRQREIIGCNVSKAA